MSEAVITTPKRNRIGKIAGGTALIAAVLAGGGTFALWQETAPADMGTVTVGSMGLESTPGTWASSLSGAIPAGTIATYKMVPGETLTYTQNLDVTMAGEGLKAHLSLDGWGDVKAGQSPFVSMNSTITDKDGATLPLGSTLTESASYDATFSFAVSADADGTVYDKAIDLAGITYKLTQDASV